MDVRRYPTLIGIEWNALTYSGCTVWNVHNERTRDGYVGGTKRRPRTDWVIKEGTHPALITREEAEALLRDLEARRSRRRYETPAHYVLTGLLHTPTGEPWYGCRDGDVRYYRHGRRVNCDMVERVVLGKVAEDLKSDKFVKALVHAAHQLESPEAEIAEIARAYAGIEELDRKIQKVTGMLAEGIERPLLAQIGMWEQEREKIRAGIIDLETRLVHARAVAVRLANRFESFFVNFGIFSGGQLSRMKHVELICELMLSLVGNDVLNKKTALDRVMATSSFDGRQIGKSSKVVAATLNRVRRMFPHLGTTRLCQVTDFYTLAVLIGKFEQERLILTDRYRNSLAWDLLKAFTTQVDEVRELQRKAKGTRAGQEMYRDYLLTVSQMTDDVNQRRKREEILRGILMSLFTQKDSQRGFTAEQRRIIWNTSANRTCSHTGCMRKLTWDDFTIDHVNPYSKGGRSQLENAALMCREHNSAKGNRRRSL